MRPSRVGMLALVVSASAACGSSSSGHSAFPADGAGSSDSGSSDSGSSNFGTGPGGDGGTVGSFGGDGAGGGGGTTTSEGGATIGGGAASIVGTLRDFKFWDGTASTNPDFEDPPYNIGQNGAASPGYVGDWNDLEIVSDTLGTDAKPVYKNPNGTPDANGRVTLTTHGKASFDMWFNDTPSFNLDVQYPLPLSQSQVNGVTQYGYDSNTAGIPYGFQSGDGFFPLDDGTPYGKPNQVTFGNQSVPTTSNPDPQGVDTSANIHNYSFTFELHAGFTYTGGEVFNFRGDDDVFVYIDSKLVINLGGIHSAETAMVTIDSLGLTLGSSYNLDFFSVERHVSGSNILFTTTLALQPIPQ